MRQTFLPGVLACGRDLLSSRPSTNAKLPRSCSCLALCIKGFPQCFRKPLPSPCTHPGALVLHSPSVYKWHR